MRLILLVLSICVMSCSYKVHTLQKPQVDFQSYDSWCWMNSCDPIYQGDAAYFNKKVIDEIYNSIAFNMHEKGYVQGDENADLIVVFHLKVKQEEVEVATQDYFESSPDYIGNNWIREEYPELIRYLKGNIVIDVIDGETSEVIWKSSIVGYSGLYETPSRKNIWKNVRRAMKKLPEKSSK